jgi:hypothetical protein
MNPELQRRRMAGAREKRFKWDVVARLHRAYGGLIDTAGRVSREEADRVFRTFDADNSGFIDQVKRTCYIVEEAQPSPLLLA